MTTLNKTDTEVRNSLEEAAKKLCVQAAALSFEDPVTHVYNPLDYAWELHCQYLQKASRTSRVLFLGMNPGPWGMAQTGVPFGEVAAVRDWMKIRGSVSSPPVEHPKRPVEGLECGRSEVSGRRLWGLMQERFGTPAKFFKKHLVVNYCPLVFMEVSGRNRTPDKLSAIEKEALWRCCDQHLAAILQAVPWKHLVGVGAFAETCLQRIASEVGTDASISRILHPSPASPAANKDWAGTATQQLEKADVW